VANLSPGSGSRAGERGQLLLIAAFIIGVSFVVLALVVNSAIFTENLATRDDVAGSDDALDYRHEVSQNLGDVVTAINQNNSVLDDYSSSNLDTPVESNVETLQRQSGIQQSSQGRVVDIAFDSWEPGLKVAQDDPRTFTNTSGSKTDWTVVENVPNTRNVKLNVTQDPGIALLSDPFEMVVERGGDEWTLTIADDSTGTDDVLIEVDRPGESPETCTSEFDGYLIIDVTGGTIGGDPCHALTRLTDGTPMWFGTGVSPDYDIRFENGDELVGTYSFVVEDPATPDDPGDFGSPGSGPYTKDAVYSASVSYHYYTQNVGFETVVRAVPGEVGP
jgi:hypothetical protein